MVATVTSGVLEFVVNNALNMESFENTRLNLESNRTRRERHALYGTMRVLRAHSFCPRPHTPYRGGKGAT